MLLFYLAMTIIVHNNVIITFLSIVPGVGEPAANRDLEVRIVERLDTDPRDRYSGDRYGTQDRYADDRRYASGDRFGQTAGGSRPGDPYPEIPAPADRYRDRVVDRPLPVDRPYSGSADRYPSGDRYDSSKDRYANSRDRYDISRDRYDNSRDRYDNSRDRYDNSGDRYRDETMLSGSSQVH